MTKMNWERIRKENLGIRRGYEGQLERDWASEDRNSARLPRKPKLRAGHLDAISYGSKLRSALLQIAHIQRGAVLGWSRDDLKNAKDTCAMAASFFNAQMRAANEKARKKQSR